MIQNAAGRIDVKKEIKEKIRAAQKKCCEFPSSAFFFFSSNETLLFTCVGFERRTTRLKSKQGIPTMAAKKKAAKKTAKKKAKKKSKKK